MLIASFIVPTVTVMAVLRTMEHLSVDFLIQIISSISGVVGYELPSV